MNEQILMNKIQKLKKEKNAVILAHNYQIPQIQEVADIVGDSLKLSYEAQKTNADCIVFAGVHFMAESAKILSPQKRVFLPAKDAGCPMADMVSEEDLKAFKDENPDIPIVCYVNSSAAVKAMSDICCTSSNAVKVVKSLKEDKLLFVPDQNLGSYVKKYVPEKEILLWKGFCITHHRVKKEEIQKIKQILKDTPILVHPECNEEIVNEADFVGSTAQIVEYAKKSNEKTFIIGTEMGIMHQLKKDSPNKTFYLLSQGLICNNMKKTRLEDVYQALLMEQHEIFVEESIRQKSVKALERMLSI